jgi:hypothetical protein
MDIPKQPYVALYGSHSGPWRQTCTQLLSANGIAWYDPSDKDWQTISDENGDQMQSVVDRLVAKQQQALLRARCVIFHLSTPNSDPANDKSLAARCELGFLMGRGIQTFVHIESDVKGRNYLWAAVSLYAHVSRYGSLANAVHAAIRYMIQQSS